MRTTLLCPLTKAFRSVTAGILLGGGLLLTGSARADSLSFLDAIGDPNSTTVSPGGFFQVTVLFNTMEPTTALTYYIDANGAGNNFFQLVGRNATGSTYSDLEFTDAQVTTPTAGRLNPRNDLNLGGIVADPNSPNPAGSYYVATLGLQALSGIAPGTYTIAFDPASVGGDANFNDVPIAGLGTYSVTVVPEPSTWALGLGGLVALGAVRAVRRRQRSA